MVLVREVDRAPELSSHDPHPHFRPQISRITSAVRHTVAPPISSPVSRASENAAVLQLHYRGIECPQGIQTPPFRPLRYSQMEYSVGASDGDTPAITKALFKFELKMEAEDDRGGQSEK